MGNAEDERETAEESRLTFGWRHRLSGGKKCFGIGNMALH